MTSTSLGAVVYSILVISAVALLSGCTTVEGYPTDPQNNATALSSLQTRYFGDAAETAYDAETDADRRQALRDKIVYGRMQAYDIQFSQFQRALNTNSNAINIGTDITAITLGAVGAVVGSSTTKSVLSAASAGVIGAQGAINKDLFYQKTVPALIAQMEANREKAKAVILNNLKQKDAVYPLQRAYIDLAMLNDAGSLPAAISSITEQANSDKAKAQAAVQNTVTILKVSTSPSSTQLKAWLYPNGSLSASRFQALQDWLDSNPNTKGLPVGALIDDDPAGKYEGFRQGALNDPKLKTLK